MNIRYLVVLFSCFKIDEQNLEKIPQMDRNGAVMPGRVNEQMISTIDELSYQLIKKKP